MNFKFYIFNIKPHTEYDSVQIQRIIKVENENTLEGFKSEIEAENWISEYGKNNVEYVILKSIKAKD